MRRAFFASELDTMASWWRIYRCDGVTLGFTTHDRDLWFDGIVHRAAPGMLPSAIRVTSGFEDDPGDIEGALSHASVTASMQRKSNAAWSIGRRWNAHRFIQGPSRALPARGRGSGPNWNRRRRDWRMTRSR